MRALDEFPPDTLPLRKILPSMRPETRDRLIQWGVTQPGSLPWLLKRSAAYWDSVYGNTPQHEDHHRLVEATAALDLLKWRTELGRDLEAVEHLMLPMLKPEAAPR